MSLRPPSSTAPLEPDDFTPNPSASSLIATAGAVRQRPPKRRQFLGTSTVNLPHWLAITVSGVIFPDLFHRSGGFPMLVDTQCYPTAGGRRRCPPDSVRGRRRAATPRAPCARTSRSTAPGAASRALRRCRRARGPSTRWRSGARRRRCAATCRASNLAALMTECCGSGYRTEGAGNERSRRPCGLSALNSHLPGSEYPSTLPNLPFKHRRSEPFSEMRAASWSRPRVGKRGEIRSRSQPKFLKVWGRITEAYPSTELYAQPAPPLEITLGICTGTDGRRDATRSRARLGLAHALSCRSRAVLSRGPRSGPVSPLDAVSACD